ncbi:ribokinase [Microbacterium enclense]|uniref:Ribokinase n=1 Tax=Microbacterium enclense TaxID=993073 RepID=A0A443JSC2_9MICO|nr:ribokinase [Microbacterium enclense]RWR23397.1 ribokinase [Microbacterium enclense]
MTSISAGSDGGVTVVGSVNLDVVVTADRRAKAGETVPGREIFEVVGGKGANQAMAAAREVRTALVAAVGSDAAGRAARGALDRAGVIIDAVSDSSRPTGRAFITLTPDGENSIIVVPLANAGLTGDHVSASLDRLRPVVVLSQLEVPLEAVSSAADWCAVRGARFLFNPSPLIDFDHRLIALADPLLVNRHEAELLTARLGASARELAEELSLVCRSVVVTDGGRGAYVAARASVELLPAPNVAAVDTTGAGDAFAGALAGRLARGESLVHATAHAVATASRIVQLARSER